MTLFVFIIILIIKGYYISIYIMKIEVLKNWEDLKTRGETVADLQSEEVKKLLHWLISQDIIGHILSKKEIDTLIDEYVDIHKQSIIDFLWEQWEFLIVMDSAKQFANRFIEKLNLTNQVIEQKVSTYENGESNGKVLDESVKKSIASKLKQWNDSKVLILEDMIDTGHTLSILVDYIQSLWVEVEVVCLFDKWVNKSDPIKQKLGNQLKIIKQIGDKFVVGYGIDFEERVCAEYDGLLEVNNIEVFIDEIRRFVLHAKIIKDLIW